MKRFLVVAVVLLSLLVVAVPAFAQGGDVCVWSKDAPNARVQSGTATCSANEDSTAIAIGAHSNATAVGNSTARSTGAYSVTNAWNDSTAIVRNGGQASASYNSTAQATNGGERPSGPFPCQYGKSWACAEAVVNSEAMAEGQGSVAYANGGSTAIATNGGCAEAWGGNTAIADGNVVIVGTTTPRFCPIAD